MLKSAYIYSKIHHVMIKAFISHSSTQKSFVEKLVETLGRTLCIIDEYDFEPAKKSKDEIFRKIRNADIFILLISKSALTSQWVQLEVGKARDRIEEWGCGGVYGAS